MDLLTSIANEFDIPIIRKDQRVWFLGQEVENITMIIQLTAL